VASAGREVATSLRRLSSWAIDSVSFLPMAAAIFFAVAFLGFAVDDFSRDLPRLTRISVYLLFTIVIWAIQIIGWLIILTLTAMRTWHIIATASIVTIISLFFILASYLTLFTAFTAIGASLSFLIVYITWDVILFGNGQTVGKRLVGIQSVRQNGESAGWGLTFLREVLKSLLHIFIIGFIIDGIMLLSDKSERQSVADRIAGTLVVRVSR